MATKKKLLEAAAGSAGGGEGLNVEEVFSTYLYEGNSSTQTINNGIDLTGEGGLTWFKCRNVGMLHNLFDTERGETQRLATSTTSAQSAQATGRYPTFTSTGFTLGNDTGGDINYTGRDYASWTFRKAPKFFDVVTYTGNGTSGRQISHNLGTKPGFIIVKRTDTGNDPYNYWRTAHIEGSTLTAMDLNTTSDASTTPWFLWSDSSTTTSAYAAAQQTSTYFTVGSHASINGSGGSFVAYLFAHNDGDGDFGPDADQDIIKCGSYTGNGSSTGPTVDLGFEPQWLMIKSAGTAKEWRIHDVMRGMPVGGSGAFLQANSSAAESTDSGPVAILPNGFQLSQGGSETNNSGTDYIYIAIRRGPMAVPTDATDVFAIDQGINSSVGDRVFNAGFPVDLMIRTDPTTTYNRLTLDRLRGNGAYVITNDTNAEADTDYAGEFDDMQGVFTDTSFDFSNHYAYMWKRAPSFCDVVAYTGNGTLGRTVSHNLGVAPEMMWIKGRDDTENWRVFHSGLPTPEDDFLYLNSTNATVTNVEQWNSTLPTSTEFSLSGQGRGVNDSNEGYIAYLFASLDGVSKVGSYTGDSTTGRVIDCGFTSGARFVLIKRTDGAGDWYVFDTERGITTSVAYSLSLNSTAAQNPTGSPTQDYHDRIDPHSSGFIVNHTAASAVNESGQSYIFYAIA